MSRRFPYRLKAPDGFSELLENIQNLHFFIVQENGPTCFIIKEEGSGKKYKVTIGDVQTCSCHAKDICCHILFVMIKVLRVPQDNPLIWQLSLVDSEVQQILQGRFRRVVETHPPVRKTKQDDKSDDNKSLNEVARKPIEDDEPCPICQEDMKDDINSTTWCKISCGNSMHIKCMIVWAEHRISLGENVTCPLCRADWGPNALRELKSIKTDYHLCLRCFQKDCHRIHPFIVQNGRGEPWKPAFRNQAIPQAILELQNREISVEDYNNLLLLDAPPMSYHEYLVDVLPKKHLLNEIKCLYCNNKMNINTDYHEITGCHHIFHDACLLEIVRSRNECPLDHTVIFNGRKKKEKKKVENNNEELYNSKPLEIDTKHSKTGKIIKIDNNINNRNNRNRRDNYNNGLPPSPFAIAGKNISINNNTNNNGNSNRESHSEIPPLPPLNGTQRNNSNNRRVNNSAPPSNTLNRDEDEEKDNHFSFNNNMNNNNKVKHNSIADVNLRRAKIAQRFLPQRRERVQPDINNLFIGKETSNTTSEEDDEDNIIPIINRNRMKNRMKKTKLHNSKSNHYLHQQQQEPPPDLIVGSTPLAIEDRKRIKRNNYEENHNEDNAITNVIDIINSPLSPPHTPLHLQQENDSIALFPPQSPISNRNEDNNNNNKNNNNVRVKPDFYTGLLTDNTIPVDPSIINESLIGSFVNIPINGNNNNNNNRKRDIHSPIVQPIDFHTNIQSNQSNNSYNIDNNIDNIESLQINTMSNIPNTTDDQKSSKPIHLLGLLNDNQKPVDPDITNFELTSGLHLSPNRNTRITNSPPPIVQIPNTNKSNYPEHIIIGNTRDFVNDDNEESNDYNNIVDNNNDDEDREIENLIKGNERLYRENGVDPDITNFELNSSSYTDPVSVNNKLLSRLYRYPSVSTHNT